MIPIVMGVLCATAFGISDFVASQNSKRIGAARSLAGMLTVGSIILSLFLLLQNGFDGLFVREKTSAIILAALHGTTMTAALLLFFHAMAVGKISVVAPIIAAHPLVIVGYHYLQGASFTVLQVGAVAGILIGVGLVGSCNNPNHSILNSTKQLARNSVVVALSIAASGIYGVSILFLQSAGDNLTSPQTVWLARVISLATVLLFLAFARTTPLPPSPKWWKIIALHGTLDAGGLLFLMVGSTGGEGNAIAAVVASTFPVITMGLAWAILKEHISLFQLLGAIVVIVGVIFLGVF